MVQTRRQNTTRKSIKQPKSNKTPIKKEENRVIGKQRKKTTHNLDRCKDWIQQQKREKLKVQIDDLDSNESDDESRDINLATISVYRIFFLVKFQASEMMFFPFFVQFIF